ncbi:hypothetical protein Acj9p093 [Acinetobacter phage Acj9]|uniref:Uncharacterized protein n=1 Tax=Acinetobacter phage Acj9 TaxID=760939 RepID=E5EPM7_9CAUD|nr:hypothetical protein Acj9p093 [Acinetobacter phage Acj9]ADG59993.1 hypothetical protein Acj9p093 [Acinetobacter phage Acj9]
MSILFAALVGVFLAFFPLVMSVYYKASTGIIIACLILCIFGFITVGIMTVVAFIVAAVGIGFANTAKSILFAILLVVLSAFFFAAELTAFVAMVS